jgi:hypothetical protein
MIEGRIGLALEQAEACGTINAFFCTIRTDGHKSVIVQEGDAFDPLDIAMYSVIEVARLRGASLSEFVEFATGAALSVYATNTPSEGLSSTEAVMPTIPAGEQ